MNDIQTKQNAFTAAAAVTRDRLDALQRTAQLTWQLKDQYLSCVKEAAICSERLRRKRDAVVTLCKLSGGLALSGILYLINVYAGAVLLAGMLIASIKTRSDNERIVDYNNRKLFFQKYGIAETFRWKDVRPEQTARSAQTEVGGQQ